MNANISKIIRLGAALALLAALLAFVVRAASAQEAPPAGGHLSLGDAIRLATLQTATVQSAQLHVNEAQARVNQARASLLPQVSAVPNWTSHTLNSASFGITFPTAPGQQPLFSPNGSIIGPVNLWDLRGQASQTVYDRSAKERINVAKAGVGAASADVSTAAEQAATTAAALYVRAVSTDANIEARIADSTLAVELLNIARDQLTAGVGVALDVTRAESQLATARAALIVARNDRDRSRLDLRRALDMPLDAPLVLTDSLTTLSLPEAANETDAIDLALRTRPDVRALDSQLLLAEQQINAIRAERLPTVGVFGNDGANGLGLDHLLNTYTYGVQLNWPIFEGGARHAREQEQTAAAQDIEVKRRDLRQEVAVDVREALLDIASARQQVDASRERQRLAEQEVEQARDRFRAGVAGNADVVTASQTLNAARTSLVEALTAYQNSRVSLARAEGTVSQLQ